MMNCTPASLNFVLFSVNTIFVVVSGTLLIQTNNFIKFSRFLCAQRYDLKVSNYNLKRGSIAHFDHMLQNKIYLRSTAKKSFGNFCNLSKLTFVNFKPLPIMDRVEQLLIYLAENPRDSFLQYALALEYIKKEKWKPD